VKPVDSRKLNRRQSTRCGGYWPRSLRANWTLKTGQPIPHEIHIRGSATNRQLRLPFRRPDDTPTIYQAPFLRSGLTRRKDEAIVTNVVLREL
jgi:hypothetical protein